MALIKRRKNNEEKGTEQENVQNQLEFEAQPESYEASDSISSEADDYSSDEQSYEPSEPEAESESEAGTEENAESAEVRKRTVKVVRTRRKVPVKAERAQAQEETSETNSNSETENYSHQNTRYNNRNYNGHRTQNGRRGGFGSMHGEMPVPINAIDPSVMQPCGDGTDENSSKPRLLINDLTAMGMHELRDLATKYGFNPDDLAPMKKQELIFVILKAHTEHGGIIFASGALEILPDGYGFLRSPQNSYLPGPDDIYISPSQIRLFNLKTGDTVYGQTRSPKEGERFFALLRIETVNFDEPRVAQTRIPFENLTALYPKEKLRLETISTEVSSRIVDLFAPIGKGQRLLIVAPPKAGKTTVMQNCHNSNNKAGKVSFAIYRT